MIFDEKELKNELLSYKHILKQIIEDQRIKCNQLSNLKKKKIKNKKEKAEFKQC